MTIVHIDSTWAAKQELAVTTWEGALPLESRTTEGQLEEVFRLFNRVTEEDVTRLHRMGYTLPSLSVGDTVTINGDQRYRVAPVGWEEL
jgi:hypothetical protein